jgi:hypothetical protein
MLLTLEMALPDELHSELEDAARACQLTARDFVAECVQAILAERRLPRVYTPPLTQGPRMRGTSRDYEDVEPEFEDAEDAGIVAHRILL